MNPLLVVGLDCVPPALAFDQLRDRMPRLHALIARGAHGPLRSTIPPITVPAWTTLFSGRDPGELGLYGFRNRVAGSYELAIASADDVQTPRLWDIAERAGIASTVLFVPPSYPVRAGLGERVSCFLTPGSDCEWAHPPESMGELEQLFGEPRFDVADVRGGDPDRVLGAIEAMTTQHFAIARHFVQKGPRPLTLMVEMGPDRLHHAAYAQLDPSHPRFDAASPIGARARDYYALLDRELGSLVDAIPNANVVVLSDHGARPLVGGVHVNEWLIERGLLTLKKRPSKQTPLTAEMIDWPHTKAWGEGGYYARIFFNMRGREPEGVLEPSEIEPLRARLRVELEAMIGPDGTSLGTRVFVPAEIYRGVRGIAPELAVFFGNLAYRSLGSVGGERIFASENDTGEDQCNHDWDGIFVAAGPDVTMRGRVALDALDVMPLLCELLGLK